MKATESGSLLRSLDERFAARRRATAETGSPAGDPFVRAAAVLHVFDAARLHPFGPSGAPSAEGRDALVQASVRAIGYQQARLRTLRPDVRKAALWGLGSRDAMRAALAANPNRTRTAVQLMFERWLHDEPLDPDRMSYTELEELAQLYGWGIAADPGLPPFHLVEVARSRRAAVAMFEHLVGPGFVGRAAALDALSRYVNGPGGGPLLISGAGGVGKTALVGRFLIEQVAEAERRLPFAYLPFDSETLDVREPFTLLLAISAQLGVQLDRAEDQPLAEPEAAFRTTVEQYRDARGSLQRRASGYAARGARISSLSATEERLYTAFAELLAAASTADSGRPRPVVLVFDTFEEVLYRAAEDLLGFWGMLRFLFDRLPQLRVVIAGRTQPVVEAETPLPTSTLVLGDLDEDDATALLVRRGVGDPATARAIARQVGGNPLSLRLAADVAMRENVGHDGIGGPVAGTLSVHLIGAELVRGQLYRRLLGHIHDPDVRALAHPGMVLRRITPAVIEEVLAPGCGLTGVDAERAAALFDELRREQALVSAQVDGSLRYREDVREPVLELLVRDKPAQVRRIHELAVAHYEGQAEPEARAEEIYHRLMLGQQPDELEQVWLPGVERYLAAAVNELPAAQRRWLAGRMSIQLPAADYERADLEEWERLIGHKAMELVRFGGPERVLALLGERSERTPASPLIALEARALLDLGRPDQAATLLDGALRRFPLLSNPGRHAELLWLRAQAAAGRDPERLAFLDQLADLADGFASRMALVQALTDIVDALPADSPRIAECRYRLGTELSRLTGVQVSEERSLVRLAMLRLGPNFPAVLVRWAPLVIFDLCDLAQRGLIDLGQAVPAVLDALGAELPQLRQLLPPADEAAAGRDLSAFVGAVVTELRRRVSRGSGSPQPLAEAVLMLLRTEGATLAGSSLAGIDEYRESWELQVTAEVAR